MVELRRIKFTFDLFGTLSFIILVSLVINAIRNASDFHVFYRTAVRVLEGQAFYVSTDGCDPFKYHPAWAYMLAPLGLLPEKVSLVLFTVTQILCWLYAANILSRWLKYDLFNSRNFFLMLLLTLNTFSAETGFGQINGFLFAGTVALVKWLEEDKAPIRAGMLLAIMITLKLNFALLICYCAFRNMKALTGLVYGVLAMHLPVIAFHHQWIGEGIYREWTTLLFTQSVEQYFTYETQGLLRFFQKLFGVNGAKLAWFASLCVYVATGFYLNWKRLLNTQPAAIASFWLAGVFFFSPLAWWYQVLFLFPMAFCMLKYRVSRIENFLIYLSLAVFALVTFSLVGKYNSMHFKEYQGFFATAVVILALFFKRAVYNKDFAVPMPAETVHPILQLPHWSKQIYQAKTSEQNNPDVSA